MNPGFRGFVSNGMEDPLDLRAVPRVGADLMVELRSSEFTGGLPGRTRDLSIGGACIATPSPFSFKSLQEVSLQLPGNPLRLQVEGCWQREEPAEALILTGVSFLQPSHEHVDALWTVVMESGKSLARFLFERTQLHELGLEEAMGLAQLTRLRHMPAGRTLYRQDTRREGEDSIYLITEGSVALQIRVRDAIERDYARLHVGDVFGGLPLVADTEHAESAVTETEVRLLEIDAAAFRYLRTAKPWLGYRLGSAVTRIAAQRLKLLLGQVRDQL